MGADIPVGERAEDCIGQRMKRDVGIAMPVKSMTMPDFYATDPQGLVRNQTVNVIPHANRGAHARPRSQQARQDSHIFGRSEEHTSELQSLMRISYAVFCLKNKTQNHII